MALIDCPACGHQVSEQAVSCPSCGHPLHAAEAPAAAQPARPANQRRRVVTFAAVAGVTLLVLVAVVLSSQGSLPVQAPFVGSGAGRPTPPSLAAAQACEDKIREQIGSLRSGQFPSTEVADVSQVGSTGGPIYSVRSYFDIPGRGNQMLHTTYTCKVRNTAPDQWELVSLEMP